MKITVVGAQCTGKTTFINDIIDAFPQFVREEYTYRDAIKDAGIENNINRKTNQESQRIIFNALAECAKRAKPYTILDRCVMDAVAYTIWPEQYSDEETDITPQMIRNMHNTAVEVMDEYDLIIFIPADENISLEDDKFRDIDPEFRRQMTKIFEELLILEIEDPNFDKYGYKVVTISGTREERIADFTEFIKAVN